MHQGYFRTQYRPCVPGGQLDADTQPGWVSVCGGPARPQQDRHSHTEVQGTVLCVGGGGAWRSWVVRAVDKFFVGDLADAGVKLPFEVLASWIRVLGSEPSVASCSPVP